MIDLLDYRKNVYSFEGEDGIIEKIFNILNVKNGFFCEFGGWDGIHGSNTRFLLENNWKGIYIESDQSRHTECCNNTQKFGNNVLCLNKTISYHENESKIDFILKDTFLPNDFDLLSIDIDSFDYQVWKSIENYKPKLVIIEIDSTHDESIKSIYDSNIGSTTSFRSMLELGNQKGYKLICSTGNMFFLRNDIDFPSTNAYHQGVNYSNWRI
jgi:hypothetical protein